jgi:hypothetical protein
MDPEAAMEEQMDGPAEDMDAMEAMDQDGQMDSPGGGEGAMEEMEEMEPEEAAVDFSNDARMKMMIGHLAENLENF